MLLGFGIISTRFSKFNTTYQKNYYYLTLSGYNAALFGSNIGFISNERKEKLSRCQVPTERTKEDIIPHQQALVRTIMCNMETDREWSSIADDVFNGGHNLTFKVLHKIFDYCKSREVTHPIIDYWATLENLAFDEITEITPCEKEPVFDIHQPTNHVFTADGIINHNSSLALKVAAEAQKINIPIFYIDLEHSLDMELASNTGVNIDDKRFCVSQPDFGEQAFSVIETVLKSGLKAFIVVDSVAALLPKAELESGFMESTQLGRQAALMSEGLRKLAGVISKSNSTVVFVNQTRQKIGSFFAGAVNTPGGNALKFYASIRLRVTRSAAITQKEETIGHITRIKIEKNKLAAPFKEVTIELYYGSGFCSISDILGIAIARQIVNQSGVWFAYEGERIGQGKLNALKFLITNKDVYRSIRDKVLNLYELSVDYPDKYIDKTIKLGDAETIYSDSENSVEVEVGEKAENTIVEAE
jgi:recombination protein RecA